MCVCVRACPSYQILNTWPIFTIFRRYSISGRRHLVFVYTIANYNSLYMVDTWIC
jgi:hypothetical protein